MLCARVCDGAYLSSVLFVSSEKLSLLFVRVRATCSALRSV